MPANLNKPFDPACCEGDCGPSKESMSARPCGCDPGAKWVCERHAFEMLEEVLKETNEQRED